MPCSVSQEEIDFYNRRANEEKYGVAWTDKEITTEVCCYLARLLTNKGLLEEAPPYVKGWIISHKRDDEKSGRTW